MKHRCNNLRQAFSLLELLVVVAILAIIAGGLITAYDGLESQAAKGQASRDIAAIDQAVRNYTTVNRTSPNVFDTMVAATYDDTNPPTSPLGGGEALAILGSKLAGKMTVTSLTATDVAALNGAGITILRYIDVKGNNATGGALDAPAFGGGSATVGSVFNVDIPNRIFDFPRPGTANRGRGFDRVLIAGDPVMLWNIGTGGQDNMKLGAAADDRLICLGVGNNCTLITQQNTTGNLPAVGNIGLANAPSYNDVQKFEYGRYLVLYNVGSIAAPRSKAKLQAVVDSRGDFLDEEIAEYTGQKP